jgi:hypothetical protein
MRVDCWWNPAFRFDSTADGDASRYLFGPIERNEDMYRSREVSTSRVELLPLALAQSRRRPTRATLHARRNSSKDVNLEALQHTAPSLQHNFAFGLALAWPNSPTQGPATGARATLPRPPAPPSSLSSHPTGVDSARAPDPYTPTTSPHPSRPEPTQKLAPSFLAYKHTAKVHREPFPLLSCPTCLSPSKSLTPQSVPSMRAAARL